MLKNHFFFVILPQIGNFKNHEAHKILNVLKKQSIYMLVVFIKEILTLLTNDHSSVVSSSPQTEISKVN